MFALGFSSLNTLRDIRSIIVATILLRRLEKLVNGHPELANKIWHNKPQHTCPISSICTPNSSLCQSCSLSKRIKQVELNFPEIKAHWEVSGIAPIPDLGAHVHTYAIGIYRIDRLRITDSTYLTAFPIRRFRLTQSE